MASDGNRPLLDDEVVFFGTFTLESGETLGGQPDRVRWRGLHWKKIPGSPEMCLVLAEM